MRRYLPYLIFLSVVLPVAAKAQFESFKDSVVQLYGVVMSADSLRGLPGVSIIDKHDGRGTVSNYQGVFSIAVLKGDEVEFTSIGFKSKTTLIPQNMDGNQFSMIQLMITDTVYLPASIIRPRPTKEQFERDFVKTSVPDDDIEIARLNNDVAKRRVLSASLPRDGKEAANFALKQSAQRYYYSGQVPPMNIFNPVAWADFIKAWKRGDFKNKN
jgi:hypothetical protein